MRDMRKIRKGLSVVLLSAVVASMSLPVMAREDRVVDEQLNVSFVPLPYSKTVSGPKGKPVHFIMTLPDKSVAVYTGSFADRKYGTVPPMEPGEIKTVCSRAQTLLGKGFSLKENKRFLLANRNGAECRFSDAKGRTIHWIGAPVAAHLIFFYADWAKTPTPEQVGVFRRLLGGTRVF
jgi:hypothetical protein